MHISNFTGEPIRLGEFPFCIDVRSIPNNHSSYGLLCYLYNFDTETEMPWILLIRNAGTKGIINLVVLCRFGQFNDLPEDIRDGDVLYDSYAAGTAASQQPGADGGAT